MKLLKGPSIYDIQNRGQVQVDACWRGRGSVACGCSHRKLEPSDVILSSSRAKLAFFGPEFRLWTE